MPTDRPTNPSTDTGGHQPAVASKPMSSSRTGCIRHGTYIGATTRELTTAGPGRRLAAVINQRVLFRHRGRAELRADRLVLHRWSGTTDLTIRADQLTSIERRFTSHYGRFLGGGSAEWGAPVILHATAVDGGVYLLFDHRAFLEKSSNVDWHLDLVTWRERCRG